jgi:hypothetical protein
MKPGRFFGAPLALAGWVFVPMLLVGAIGVVTRTPNTLQSFKWLLGSLLSPHAVDDSWMPMSVALEVTRGPRASEIFQAVFFERQIKFQYPPSSLLALEPFAYFGVLEPRVLNGLNSLLVALNAALLGRFAYRLFSRGQAGSGSFPDRRWAALIAAATGFSFFPIVQAHNLGQIQIWVDLFVTAACLLWLEGKQRWAGVAIGLACLLKPQLGLFLPWALVFRRWDFGLGLVLLLLPFELLSLARYGLQNHISYLDVLSHLSRHGESFQYNQSVNGLLHRLLFNGCNLCPPGQPTPLPPFHPFVHYATLGSSLLLLAVSFAPALLRGRKPPDLLVFSLGILCFTMASPVAWYHHYGVVLPVFLVALWSLLREPAPGDLRPRFALAALAAAWVLVSNNIGIFNWLEKSRWNVLQSHLFFGAVLLLVVLAVRVLRSAEERPFA